MGLRRISLILIASLLIVADGMFLASQWHRDEGTIATITYAGIDSAGFIISAEDPAPSLRNGRWEIGHRPIPDLAAYFRIARGKALDGRIR